jgi:prevent-host-death family protein
LNLDFWPESGYFQAMSEYSVVQAKNNLSDLIDRAVAGEAVVVTRHGVPVVELKALRPQGRPMTEADIDWLRASRQPVRGGPDSGELLSRMRDEDEARLL